MASAQVATPACDLASAPVSDQVAALASASAGFALAKAGVLAAYVRCEYIPREIQAHGDVSAPPPPPERCRKIMNRFKYVRTLHAERDVVSRHALKLDVLQNKRACILL